MIVRRAVVLLLTGINATCAPSSAEPRHGVVPAAAPSPAAPGAEPAKANSAIERQDVLVVTDPLVLDALETRGFGLGELLDGRHAANNGALAAGPGYASIASVLESDVRAAAAGDPLAGTSLAKHSHRLFNAAWLRSPDLRFELVGVVNRLDRRPFHPTACGELRMVYRLSYATERKGVALASRLPLTISLELPLEPRGGHAGCVELAARFRPERGLAGERLAAWLSARGKTTH
jgi:hypothetical protein